MQTLSPVMLVGAGPGDPELLTLKAVRALAQAEVVLIDDLVNPALLGHCKGARVIPVGKRGGFQSTPQHFINRMLITLACQGLRVVRLKGGDGFVFGRGGEEMLALRAAGIPYQVIPGITSGLAACTSMEVPATHRHLNHGVTLVTGHTQNGEAPNWPALVQSRTTLVIYMGLKHLAEICKGLIAGGMSAAMPCMVVSHATRPEQQSVIGTLLDIHAQCQMQHIVSPAMIVVGEVVRLAKETHAEDGFEQLASWRNHTHAA